jgi:hypothetical protein
MLVTRRPIGRFAIGGEQFSIETRILAADQRIDRTTSEPRSLHIRGLCVNTNF